jgi:hypothetical protein
MPMTRRFSRSPLLVCRSTWACGRHVADVAHRHRHVAEQRRVDGHLAIGHGLDLAGDDVAVGQRDLVLGQRPGRESREHGGVEKFVHGFRELRKGGDHADEKKALKDKNP